MKTSVYTKVLVVLMITIFSLAVFFKDSLFSYASSKERNGFIRVGLTKEFKSKQTLIINNKALLLGISKKNEFYPLEELRSEVGIKFSKKTGNFRVLEGTYSSLRLAEIEANRLGKKGELLPVFSGMKRNEGSWKLYYTGTEDKFDQVSKPISKNEDFLLIEGDDFSFFVDAKKAKAYPQFESANHWGEKMISLEGKRYRGRMEIGSYRMSGVTAVNVVRIEDYIRGVVPLEMGYTWHLSAMKAQAVAARSFALATAGFHSDSNIIKGFKLNNVSHQSYGGFDIEGEKPNKACRETKGEYLLYKNKVVRAFFYSTSGGKTESPENVWGGKKVYLKSVSDIYESKPEKKPWSLRLHKNNIQKMISAIAAKKGVVIGGIKDIRMLKFSPSERLMKLKVIGDSKDLVLEKNEIRTTFQLPSTKVRVFSSGQDTDRVSIAYKKQNQFYKRTGNLKGKTVLSKKGKTRLSYRNENGGQVMILAHDNRKGFYLGEVGEDEFAFVGTGFGHGVGMSQSGANGMAEAGFGYKRILMHYYKGAQVR